MPYNWKELLDVARVLQAGATNNYTEQAAFRSAVGRAYYAAYNHACVYAEEHLSFNRTREPDDHRRLRKHLADRGQPQIAADLDDLRIWRNTCDYDDTKPIRLISEMVKPSIEKAGEIIEALQ